MATKKKAAATTQKYLYSYEVDNDPNDPDKTGHGLVKATSPREAVAKALIEMSWHHIYCLTCTWGTNDEFELIDVGTEKDVTPVPDGADGWSGPWVATEEYLKFGYKLKLETAEILTVDGTKVYFFVEDPEEKY